jgi:disulfide bond formation protein DsbB
MKLTPILSVARAAFVIALALSLVACGGAAQEPTSAPAPAGDATHGKTVYDSTCVACHGPDAKGLPNLGKDLTTSEFVASQSDADLVNFIKTGRPIGDPLNTTGVEMPARGGNPALTDQDMADVVAYLRTLQQ